MSDVSHERVRECIEELMDLPEDARRPRLEAIGNESPGLRREVESLMAYVDADESPLDDGGAIQREAQSIVNDAMNAPSIPERVGGFRIERQLSSGGMGVVYVAEQDSPRRQVALKMLRSDILVNEQATRRFKLETEILGRLHHPGIAEIYEAGTIEWAGAHQPYFAMELVDGRPINQHAADLDFTGRLELFVLVCRAVHHAHELGVVHRDLKPDNILVEAGPEGSVGKPKILDFGVARSTDVDIQLTTMHTDVGQLVGTVPYMSPEQLGGEAHAVDRRSDVYALGVILFELLTGRLPHDVQGLALADAVIRIRDADPTSLTTFDTRFRGDLDTIAAKALEKEPGRRYDSAAELADDVQRHLTHEPIRARPASTWYQLARFSRRNPVLVGSAALIAVLTVVAFVVLSRTTLRALNAEESAEARYEEASAIADFYENVLRTTRSMNAGPEITVAQVVDEMAKILGDEFDGSPVARARVLHTLGAVYRDLGRLDDAHSVFEVAHALRIEHLGPDDPDTQTSALDLALSFRRAGEGHRAIEMLAEAVEGLEVTDGVNGYRTVATLVELANALDDDPTRLEEAGEVYHDITRRLNAADGAGDGNHVGVVAHANGGILARRLGDDDLAEQRFKRALEVGLDNPEVPTNVALNSMSQLGNLYQEHGRLDEAEPLLRSAYERTLEMMGHGFVGTSMHGDKLALLLKENGDYEGAEALLLQSIESLTELLGEGHRYTLRLRQHLAELRLAEERVGDALALAESALADAIETQGADSTWCALFSALMGDIYATLDRRDEAIAAYLEAERAYDSVLGANSESARVVRERRVALEGAGT